LVAKLIQLSYLWEVKAWQFRDLWRKSLLQHIAIFQ